MNEEIPPIDSRRTALLLMDYQPMIVGHLPGGEGDALLGRASEALALARARGMQIGYVWVGFGDADYAAVPETNKSFFPLAARPGFLHKDVPESGIDPRIAPRTEDIVVRKVRVGALSTTDLNERLRNRGIDTLVLAGISTSGVVLSTVRDAADRDYRLFVLSDACADTDDEVHNVLMRKVFPKQAYVITVADLPGLLEAR